MTKKHLIAIAAELFDKHQMKIAKSTLRLSDAGAAIMGGMTKDEARTFLRRQGWTNEKITAYENAS